MSILDQFELKGSQFAAAARLTAHLAVTAGAGSGKTRALVARYLHFVEQGAHPRSLIAITFTEKAAREMRSRIRHEIERQLSSPGLSGETASAGRVGGAGWQTIFADLDSARIGTIHSLCADLLRLFPAEAGVDPRFKVLEEGLAATLRAQAVEAALVWAAADPYAARLFAAFKENDLRRILATALEKRLDADAFFPADPLALWEHKLKNWLDEKLSAPAWRDSLATLSGHRSSKDDDKLEAARRGVLAGWRGYQTARAAAEWDVALDALREMRAIISTAGQKANWDASSLEAVRGAMKALREVADDTLKPILKSNCRWELDRQAAELIPVLHRLFNRALAVYQSLKENRLDFDDLESLAVRLLNSSVPSGQSVTGLGVSALLVDEFQDTNDRQRQIVYALAGFTTPPLLRGIPSGAEQSRRSGAGRPPEGGALDGPGAGVNLFIVGDSKQSIYRFRGADVTVFRRIQSDITRAGGELIDLDLTFRAHAPLLDLTNRLLAPLMGLADDPARPYRVPFAPLTADRQRPAKDVREPFAEFHIGVGDADSGRQIAAAALAARLHELHAQEGFTWDGIALLFRASTAFPVYEDALEAAGIPFVTVAGKGFYDRPEIRDLLNALAALADPSDDLALAGLLRSHAFALTDSDLYQLRVPTGSAPRSLFKSLTSNLAYVRIANTIAHLHALAGRLPVAEVLKHFFDLTHYRAVLNAVGGSNRLSRNVDKLLADAHRSRLVSIGDFLDYVGSLRDVGAREGEAPADPAIGSVQLMTMHKAKGLEFALVVIADAAYDHVGRSAAVQFDPEFGALLRVGAEESRPVSWQLGALADADRDDAEDLRLLYVAVTRAKEKLIVSGHTQISASKSDPGRLLLSGWLGRLGSVIGLTDLRLPVEAAGSAYDLKLALDWSTTVKATLHLASPALSVAHAVRLPHTVPLTPSPLIRPLVEGPMTQTTLPTHALDPALLTDTCYADPPARLWRVVASGGPPAWVVGKLVHEAIRRWLFPDAQNFEARLRPAAIEAGLTGEAAVGEALRETRRLLNRFHTHPIFAEMGSAVERYHEVPYLLGGDAGVIDVIYRLPSGWVVVDFKTDQARDAAEVRAVIRAKEYDEQLRRYAAAVTAQFGAPPRTLLVFLNAREGLNVVETG